MYVGNGKVFIGKFWAKKKPPDFSEGSEGEIT